jgi:phosphoribosylamine--glycine ligase
VTVFHAGTAPAAPTPDAADPGVITAGGRVLGVTGVGRSIAEARDRAYAGTAAISWPGVQVRTDIARAAAAGAATGEPVLDEGATTAFRPQEATR